MLVKILSFFNKLMGLLREIGKIKEYSQNCDKIRYGIDYLRFNFERSIPYYENIMAKIDTDNSNIYYDDNLEMLFQKVWLSSGPAIIASVSYGDQPIPIFMYNVFSLIKSKYSRMDIYGSYFRLEEIGFFPHGFYQTLITDFTTENPTISRIDYCCDLFYKIKTPLPTYKKFFSNISLSNSVHDQRGKGDSIESWAVGNKANKSIFIRMYDKLFETSVKGKFFLYQDYLNYDSVHRFEVQFGPSFTKGKFLSTLDNLILKIANIFALSSVQLDESMFYHYGQNTELSEYSRLFFVKGFVCKSKRFFQAGVNPFLLLMEYYDKNTITIGSEEQYQIYLRELELKLQNHYLLVKQLL